LSPEIIKEASKDKAPERNLSSVGSALIITALSFFEG